MVIKCPIKIKIFGHFLTFKMLYFACNISIYFQLIKSDNKVMVIKCPIKIKIFGRFLTFKMLYFWPKIDILTQNAKLLSLRPPLIEKLFPVHRPSGLKRADWNFFFMIFEKSCFFLIFFQYFTVDRK